MASSGPTACQRCGAGIMQAATGRRRLYCGRTCRELAYRARATDRTVNDALKAAGVDPDQDSSVVETAPVPVTSVVETRVPRPSRRRAGMTTGALVVPYDD